VPIFAKTLKTVIEREISSISNQIHLRANDLSYAILMHFIFLQYDRVLYVLFLYLFISLRNFRRHI